MKHAPSSPSLIIRGFSLVEVLAAIAIIGIVTFLAIPNIVSIKEDGERNLAISRVEALNMAVVAYYQKGGSSAVTSWSDSDNDGRYVLIAPYLAFAPSSLTAYMPGGYTATLPTSLPPTSKTVLKGPGNTSIPY